MSPNDYLIGTLRRIDEINAKTKCGLISFIPESGKVEAEDILELARVVAQLKPLEGNSLSQESLISFLKQVESKAREEDSECAAEINDVLSSIPLLENNNPSNANTTGNGDRIGRRQMMFGLAGIVAAGAMLKTEKVEALEDSATLAKILLNAEKAYTVAKDTMGVINKVNEGINRVGRVFTGGVDGLMGLTQESGDKQLAANAAAADRNNETMWSIERTRNELGAQPSSGACNADAAATVAKEMAVKKDAAGASASKNRVASEFKATSRNDGAAEGEAIAKEITDNKWESLSGGTLVENYDPKNSISAASRQKVLDRATRAPSSIPKGSLKRYAQTTSGKNLVADLATREIRRGAAIAAVSSISEAGRADSTAYNHIHSQIQSAANTDTSMIEDADEKARIDSKMLAYSSALLQDLEEKKKKSGTNGLSYNDLLAFRVRSKDSPSFYEFIRSTGNTEAPLLREIIDQNSISLQIQLENLKQQRDQTVLLSYILMEIQDDPDRVSSLVERSQAALKI